MTARRAGSRRRGTPEGGAPPGKLGRVALGSAALLGAGWALRRLRRGASLDGQVALVTGGSRGLGFLLAERLVAEGCHVAICARDRADLSRARTRLARLGGEVMIRRCDVSDSRSVEAMIDEVEVRLGPVDILVNNAATIQVAPLETLSVEDFRSAIDVAFMGTVHTCLAVLPTMRTRRRGRIANITSIGGKIAVPHLLPYDAAKFAAVGFSEGLRAEVAKDGVAVTTVVPGLMRTGSPARVEYRGQPEKEYRWFAMGDLLPLSAMSAEAAADRIVRAIRRGEAEVVLSWQAKLVRAVHDLAPGATMRALGLVSRLLPAAGAKRSAPGTDLRGALPEAAERALDRAATRSNQGVATGYA